MNDFSDKNCVTCELKCDIFKLLTKEELELINNTRTEARFKKGEVIFKQGAPTSHIIFLVEGITKLYIEGYDNKDLILTLVKPTQYIVGPGLYFENKYHYSAIALTDVFTCFVDGNLFKQLVRQNRDFSDAFITEFSRRSTNTFQNFVNLTQKKMPGRIAGGLLYLSDFFGSTSFNMVLSKKEIGDLTGMARESAVRILNEFNEEGIISLNGNNIEINDMERLIGINNKG